MEVYVMKISHILFFHCHIHAFDFVHHDITQCWFYHVYITLVRFIHLYHTLLQNPNQLFFFSAPAEIFCLRLDVGIRENFKATKDFVTTDSYVQTHAENLCWSAEKQLIWIS